MDDSKVNDLRSILRDLSWLLGQQQEIILSQAVVSGAIRMTLEGDPALSKKYEANLQSLKGSGRAKPDQAAMGLTATLLQRMKSW